MPNMNLTHISVVLDRSGSMQTICTDTQGGFDAFIQAQQKEPGECTVTLVQFDDTYEVVYEDKPLSEVPPLQLHPRGNTALLDAIGKAIVTTGERLTALPEYERPASVIFVILTDGHENASEEYTLTQVKGMITHQQETYSWLFQFFGADADAIDVAGSIGIHTQNAMQYTGQNVGQAFASASRSSGSFRGAMTRGVTYGAAVMDSAFTDEEREEAAKE